MEELGQAGNSREGYAPGKRKMTKARSIPQNHVWILLVLLALGLCVRLAMIWVDFGLLTCGLEILQDDSMYNYKVARNIVDGYGLTFEVGEPIYAYHPPSVLFIIPFIWLFPDSKELPVQCLLSLYTLISLATTLFIYRAVRHLAGDEAGLISAGFWILSFGIAAYSICGADVPVTAFFLSMAADYYVRRIHTPEGEPKPKHYAVLGLLCGCCILSRMDTLLLLPAFGLDMIWSHRKAFFWKGFHRTVVNGCTMFLAAAVITAPFFLRHLLLYGSFEVHNASSNRTLSIVMGHYARTAGLQKYLDMREHETPRSALNPMVTDLDDEIYPVWWGLYALCAVKGALVLPAKYGDIFIPLLLFLAVVFCNAHRRKRGERTEQLRRFFQEGGIASLGVFALYGVMHYSLYAFFQFSFWHLSRYMYPLAFVGTLLLGPVSIWALRRILLPRFQGRLAPLQVILLLFGLSMVSFSLQLRPLVQNLCKGGNGFIQAAQWINDHTPRDSVIGFYQGGYFGYYLERTFHDLGGKATVAAWKAWLGRQEWDYIQKRDVDYIVDEDFYLDFVFGWSKMYPIQDKLDLVNDEFSRRPGTKILIFKVKKPSGKIGENSSVSSPFTSPPG